MDEKEAKRLLDKFDTASTKLKNAKAGQLVEMEYALAYQTLVRAGLAGQIKKKYRKL